LLLIVARVSFSGLTLPHSMRGLIQEFSRPYQMPNIKSSKKRMELSRKYNVVNRKKRSTLRTAMKKVRHAESIEDARANLERAVALLDRAATKRLVHPNKAARLKSQLQQHVNGLAG
jgi:small subunit ribosomal protein S20